MKIALIIIGVLIGIVQGAFTISKTTPERQEVFRKHPGAGCGVMFAKGLIGGLLGWLVSLFF